MLPASARGGPRPTSSAAGRPARRGVRISGADQALAEELGEPKLEGINGTGSDLSRLFSLSDGVFAFALTFLAITLLLPQTARGTALPVLSTYLGSLQGAFIGYILSFLVIASWWNIHHRLFSAFVRYDPTLVRLNSFFLLGVSVTPFLVSLLFAYSPAGFGQGSLSAREAVALYSVAQGASGGVLLVVWRHGTQNHRLIRPKLPEEWVRATEHNLLISVGTFVVSIPVAFLSPLLAELTWIIVILGLGRRFWRATSLPPDKHGRVQGPSG